MYDKKNGWVIVNARVYVFPPLKQCREKYNEITKCEILWPNPDEDWLHEQEVREEEPIG